MNVINFDTISIKNFKSIGEEVTFSYKDLKGMTYVVGDNKDIPEVKNGVGKSVIFVDALLMVLFGQTANSVNNKHLFHRRATENVGWIKLRMEVNGQEWNVHCILNRANNRNVGLGAELYKGPVCDENNVTKSRKSETLKFLAEEVLKSDADTFRNAVILSTANIQNLFQIPKPAREAYLDSVFMLAAFGKVYTEVKRRANQIKKELATTRESFETIKLAHGEILKKSKLFIDEKKQELKELTAEINQKKAEIEKLKLDVVNIDDLESQMQMYMADIVQYEQQTAALKKEMESYSVSDADISLIIDEYSNEQRAILDEKKKVISVKIDELTKKIEQVNEVIAVLKEKIAQSEVAEEEINKQMMKLGEEVKDIHLKRTKVDAQIKAMLDIHKKFESTINLLCEECVKKTHNHFEFDQDLYDKLQQEHIKLTKEIDLKTEELIPINEKRLATISERKEFTDKIEKADHGIETIQTQIVGLQTDSKNASDETAAAIAKQERILYEEARAQFQKSVDENVAKSSAIAKLINDAKDEIRRVQGEISKSQLCITQIEQATTALKELATRYKKTEDKVNPFDDLVAEGEKKIQDVKDSIQTILNDQRKFELLSMIYCEVGVKKYIVANIVASLNVLIKKYLTEMGTDYTVIFDDKFEYEFYTSSGECDYWNFSSGERRRLDMAVMLALRDILFTNGLVTNVLIVDEVLDSGIDGYALYAVLNILKNKTMGSNLGCTVISHRNEILEDVSDIFDRVYTVVKENGQTSLGQGLNDQQG